MLFSRAESNTGNGKTLTVSSHDLRALESRFHFRNPIVVNKKQKTKKRKEKQTNKKNTIPVVLIVENVLARQHPNYKNYLKKKKET